MLRAEEDAAPAGIQCEVRTESRGMLACLERPSSLSQGTARTTPLPCPQRLGVGLPISLAESRVLTRQT